MKRKGLLPVSQDKISETNIHVLLKLKNMDKKNHDTISTPVEVLLKQNMSVE